MTDATTPLADGTPIGLLLGGKLYGRNLLASSDGTLIDPATAQGQEAIRAAVAGLVQYLDGIEPGLAAVVAAIAGATYFPPVQSVSAQALPLPAGAATDATAAKSAPADNFAAVTPSDTIALSVVPKALLIGGAGNLAIKGGDGNAVTIAVVAGQILPVRARYVLATGTSATGIVAIA